MTCLVFIVYFLEPTRIDLLYHAPLHITGNISSFPLPLPISWNIVLLQCPFWWAYTHPTWMWVIITQYNWWPFTRPPSLSKVVRRMPIDDVVLVDVDESVMESPHVQDLEAIPSEIITELKHVLKKQASAYGDTVARSFLRAQVCVCVCLRMV